MILFVFIPLQKISFQKQKLIATANKPADYGNEQKICAQILFSIQQFYVQN
jgi:hypothetical protein